MSYVHDTMSYVDIRHRMFIRCRTYDVVRHIARTTSYVRYDTRFRRLHVRCRTSCTYDIVYTYDIVGGKNPDVGYRHPGRDRDSDLASHRGTVDVKF